ncbi:hypothetical protein GGR60_000711 [Xanthomonas arboricola]|nr:hypothetical protein [Xanthomonas euroxanthea]
MGADGTRGNAYHSCTTTPGIGRARLTAALRGNCADRSYPIRSIPPMYGRSASGTSIEPSAFW